MQTTYLAPSFLLPIGQQENADQIPRQQPTITRSPLEQIQQHLHTLRMSTAVGILDSLLQTATRETWPLETFLAELLEQEVEGRSQRRIKRLQKSSHLPAGKTLATFEQQHLPLRLSRQLA